MKIAIATPLEPELVERIAALPNVDLEMNTRIQVEHTISEEISGIDLAREQICAAAGWPLALTQDEIEFRGHATTTR